MPLTNEEAQELIDKIESQPLENSYNNYPGDEAIVRLGDLKKIINSFVKDEPTLTEVFNDVKAKLEVDGET